MPSYLQGQAGCITHSLWRLPWSCWWAEVVAKTRLKKMWFARFETWRMTNVIQRSNFVFDQLYYVCGILTSDLSIACLVMNLFRLQNTRIYISRTTVVESAVLSSWFDVVHNVACSPKLFELFHLQCVCLIFNNFFIFIIFRIFFLN